MFGYESIPESELTKVFSYPKILLVMSWNHGDDAYDYSSIQSLITESAQGIILDSHSLIGHCTDLWFRRIKYDGYMTEHILEAKTTRDGSIIGPISDYDKNIWVCDELSALTACGFHNYMFYIIDSRLLSRNVDELKVYVYDRRAWRSPKFINCLTNFDLSIIPAITENNLDHHIPELLNTRFRYKSNLKFACGAKICRLKPSESGWEVSIEVHNIDTFWNELKFKDPNSYSEIHLEPPKVSYISEFP